ncbi:MAG: hypothetical protein K2J60_08580 [Acetatifactor sp.]|nr:hypothetical protein [Acetatifactor sp.]
METRNLYFINCGRCGTGKSSGLIASFEKILEEIYLIWVEEIERELEEALRRDLARKTVCFVQHLGVSPICSRMICRIDEEICVEKRYVSVELTISEQIESIEKITFSRLHSLFQNNIVNPVDTLKSFVYNNISAFKNLHAEGQVRSLIPLKKETSLKEFANEKRLHRPVLLLLCKKRVLRSSVKKKQIWKCKSNGTLKNLYYKWTSVFANLVIMRRLEDSRIFV